LGFVDVTADQTNAVEDWLQIRRIAKSFRPSEVDLSALYEEVLLRKPEPAAGAARLSTARARELRLCTRAAWSSVRHA
jgi:hypothetical protein